MNQTSFAVEVLKVAVSTQARYETSTPPRGDVLQKLAVIAGREALNPQCIPEQRARFLELRDTFQVLYFKDCFEDKGFDAHATYSWAHLPGGGQDIGFLMVKTESEEEARAARFFLTIFLQGLRNSTVPAARAEVLDALETLENSVLTQMEKERFGRDPEATARLGDSFIRESQEIVLKSIEGKK